VVVDVRLALMLAFGVLVGLVVVLDGRVVVLVVVRRRQVAPLLAVGQVVDHVMVVVPVDDALVAMVGHDASFGSGPRSRVLHPGLRHNRRGTAERGWGRIGATRVEEVDMGFKSGLLVGFGVGYVLGSKAGRERYDELRAAWDQFVGNPSVQRVVTKGREVVDTGVNRGIRAVEDASDEVKSRVEGTPTGKGSTTST
jgi:hypothetical protein